ncbi:membrane protein [Microbacterium phage Mercedes]|nr:membrane protein [Microbacterium phage Mercedes]
MNVRKLIASATTALVVGGGLALATALPASAHTPEVTATCSSVSATLTNYEYVEAQPAQTGTRVVTPAVPYQPAVYGERPLITPAVEYVPANPGTTQYEYRQLITGKTKWLDSKTWNPGLGWYATGNTQVVGATPEVPAQEAVYGDAPLISPEVLAQPEVTEQYEVKPAVPAQDNSIEFYVDGTLVKSERFGTSYTGSVSIDGAKGHQYSVVIDAIGTTYDKTLKGKTTACPPVTVELPTLTVTPPTCDADGSLPFLNNPAAQNPNGYEFPGQGFRVYLDRAFEGAGTYTATLQKIGAGFDPAFPYGTKVTGQTTQVLVVGHATGYQSGDAEAPCYVAPPEEPEEPTTPTEPEEPATPEQPSAPEQPVAQPATVQQAARVATAPETGSQQLAQTGADPLATAWGLTGGALAVAAGAGLVVLGLRRRQVS